MKRRSVGSVSASCWNRPQSTAQTAICSPPVFHTAPKMPRWARRWATQPDRASATMVGSRGWLVPFIVTAIGVTLRQKAASWECRTCPTITPVATTAPTASPTATTQGTVLPRIFLTIGLFGAGTGRPCPPQEPSANIFLR